MGSYRLTQMLSSQLVWRLNPLLEVGGSNYAEHSFMFLRVNATRRARAASSTVSGQKEDETRSSYFILLSMVLVTTSRQLRAVGGSALMSVRLFVCLFISFLQSRASRLASHLMPVRSCRDRMTGSERAWRSAWPSLRPFTRPFSSSDTISRNKHHSRKCCQKDLVTSARQMSTLLLRELADERT